MGEVEAALFERNEGARGLSRSNVTLCAKTMALLVEVGEEEEEEEVEEVVVVEAEANA